MIVQTPEKLESAEPEKTDQTSEPKNVRVMFSTDVIRQIETNSWIDKIFPIP